MGCSKSKSQQGTPEPSVHGEHINRWGVTEETQSFYGQNHEDSQYRGLNNSAFHSDHTLNYDLAYTSQPVSHSFPIVNATGSFGAATPAYNSYSDTQHFIDGDYNVNFCNQSSSGPTVERVSMHTDLTQQQLHLIQYFPPSTFNHEQFQGTSNNQSCSTIYQQKCYGTYVQKQIMGPPSRPSSANSNFSMPHSARPLRRRNSLNNDYSRVDYDQNYCYNSNLVRHNSLEKIRTRFRVGNFRNNYSSDDCLYHNTSSVDNEHFHQRFNQRQGSFRERVRQQDLKRKSWDDDYLDFSRPVTENIGISDEGPRVKRRPEKQVEMIKGRCEKHVLSDGKKCDPEISSARKNEQETRLFHGNHDVDKLTVSDQPFHLYDILVFPEEWSSCAIDKTGFVPIPLISPEGKSVLKYFNRTSRAKDFKLCIAAISRIENPFMHSFYLLKKEEMQSRNEHVDELYLYHGTKKEYLPKILEDNLNWRLCSEKHRFGQGISFSPVASYSSHYCDKTLSKVMLLFKVLVSNSIGGSADMKVPPTINDVVYDASIKDDTTVIVKYSDNEFYPLYKITYTKIMRTKNN